MPFLYVVILIFLILSYWVNKCLCKYNKIILVFKIYKLPATYDLTLSNAFISMILFGIFIHSLFGFWIYSNTNILADVKIL